MLQNAWSMTTTRHRRLQIAGELSNEKSASTVDTADCGYQVVEWRL
jgi:hypothetical protein